MPVDEPAESPKNRRDFRSRVRSVSDYRQGGEDVMKKMLLLCISLATVGAGAQGGVPADARREIDAANAA